MKDARRAPWLIACAGYFKQPTSYLIFVSNLIEIFNGEEDKIRFGVP